MDSHKNISNVLLRRASVVLPLKSPPPLPPAQLTSQIDYALDLVVNHSELEPFFGDIQSGKDYTLRPVEVLRVIQKLLL